MDHLLKPNDCIDLKFEIPYLCENELSEGPIDIVRIPHYQGFKLDRHCRLSFEELARYRPYHRSSFLQSWLFFGLLRQYFGNSEYRHRDFITASKKLPTRILVTTRVLEKLLLRKEQRLLEVKASEARAERDRVQFLLEHAAHCCAELDQKRNPYYHTPDEPEWPLILLSIKVLIQTLDTTMSLPRQLHKPHHDFVPNYVVPPSELLDPTPPSLARLQAAMMEQGGWCYHRVQDLGRANTYHALFYLASLRRYPGPWIDHGKCFRQDQCTAYNVDESAHRVLHVKEGCECQWIKAPNTNLRITESGGTPFVQCERRKGRLPKLTHGVVQPGSKYTAISHIWSDGLGNLLGNELPLCQLERTLDQVEALQAEMSTFSKSLVGECWQGIRALEQRISSSETRQVNFWMDIFCNPVVPKDSDPVHTQHIKDILAKGISRLMPTYIFAEHVLILDHEVQQAALSQGKTELLSRLAVSGWRSRCWTHQEYCFSRIPIYQCVDGLGPLPRIEEGADSEAKTMQESIHQELQSLSPSVLQPTPDIQDPLDLVLGLGFSSTSPEDLEHQRAIRFIRVWNDLSRKNITHNYDSLEILANLLELRAGDLLGLSPRDQMKVVLSSHNQLPLDLLFSSTKRLWDIEDDRWIPCFPKGGEPLRELSLQMQVTPAGIVIPSDLFSNNGGLSKQSSSMMAVEARDTKWHPWMRNVITLPGKKFWVNIFDTGEGQLNSVPECTDVIYILDTTPLFSHTSRSGRTGFCLLVRKTKSADDQANVETSYISRVRWDYVSAESEAETAKKYPDFRLPVKYGTILGPDFPDFLIVNDLSTAVHLEPRRNLFIPKDFTLKMKLYLMLQLQVPVVICIGLLTYKWKLVYSL